MFHLLLEDIAIQCHSFSESKINAYSRNSVWQEANTQYYVRQIFGARGNKALLSGAIDVRDGICLNVNGPGGASATIIVRRCCAVSVYVMAFGMSKGSIEVNLKAGVARPPPPLLRGFARPPEESL